MDSDEEDNVDVSDDSDGSDDSDEDDEVHNYDGEREFTGDSSIELEDYREILEANEHLDDFGRVYSTGKRKTSVARVWIQEGSGQFIINGKRITEYFQMHPREHVLAPFLATRSAGFFDVWCTVKGGGTLGKKAVFNFTHLVSN